MSDTVYSISRLDTINNCLYEAYQTYRLNDRGDNNIWGYCGSHIHKILQNIVEGTATEKDLLPAMNEELQNLDKFGISFPKDSKGGDSIRDSWISDMTHFCKTYISPKNKNLRTEVELNWTDPNGHKLVGFADLIKENKDGSIEIYDYKTSGMYSKQDMLSKGRQLVLYSMMCGKKVRSANWIFLRYIDVTYMGYKTIKSKEKVELKKTIERRKLVKELEKSIRVELAEQNCSNIEIDFLMEDALKDNIIPNQVAHIYKIKPCVVTYDITDELKDECLKYIDSTIKMWESLSNETLEKEHRSFSKTQNNGKVINDLFYCYELCGHKKNCPHFQDYIAIQQTNDNYEDLF